jgi:GTPase SAR1 family protein
MMSTHAILITGPPGAGKTSVLEKLATLLEIEGVEFGALELEQLGWGSPFLYGEPVARQLEAVLAVQREIGRRLFLIAMTAETEDDLRRAGQATGADHVTTVLLQASPDTVAARIQQREPDDWPGKQSLIEHARELAVSMPPRLRIDIRIVTDDAQPRDVAHQLWSAVRELDGPR